MEKPLEAAWMSPQAWWGVLLGNHQCRQTMLDILMEIQIWVLSILFRQGGVSCQNLSMGERCPSSFHPQSQTSKFLPVYPWRILSCCTSARTQRQWVRVSSCKGPLRGTSGLQKRFCHSAIVPAAFTTRSYGDLSSQPWNPRLGVPVQGWNS